MKFVNRFDKTYRRITIKKNEIKYHKKVKFNNSRDNQKRNNQKRNYIDRIKTSDEIMQYSEKSKKEKRYKNVDMQPYRKRYRKGRKMINIEKKISAQN